MKDQVNRKLSRKQLKQHLQSWRQKNSVVALAIGWLVVGLLVLLGLLGFVLPVIPGIVLLGVAVWLASGLIGGENEPPFEDRGKI